MRQKKLPEVTPDDMWLLLLSTIRYSLGRSSYIVSTCRILYDNYKAYLTIEQRRQIAREVDAELRRCEDRWTTLGMEVDHRTWRQLVTHIDQELSDAPSPLP